MNSGSDGPQNTGICPQCGDRFNVQEAHVCKYRNSMPVEPQESLPDDGRISSDPEGFIAMFLRNRAQDVEDGHYTLEGLSQSWPEDDDGNQLYRIKVTFGRKS